MNVPVHLNFKCNLLDKLEHEEICGTFDGLVNSKEKRGEIKSYDFLNEYDIIKTSGKRKN